MRIDDGRDIVLLRELVDELVDDRRGLGVKTGVWLVAEELFWIECQSAGDGSTLHHPTTDLSGILLRGFGQTDTLQ